MTPVRLSDYQSLARTRLPQEVWEYIEGGSGTESALRGNREALDALSLRPRVLVDVSEPDIRATLLGQTVTAPIGIAPMAYHRLVDGEGEIATARAAAEVGVPMVVSMFASCALEEIAAVTGSRLWLQLYWLRRRDLVVDLVRRAEDAGFRGLVLTVDAPRLGRRLRDIRNGFALPEGVRAVNLDASTMATSSQAKPGRSAIEVHAREQFDTTITWSDLAWLRDQTSLPLVLKGILTGEDAAIAARSGVDAVIVSNHGGRQLDHATASVDALAEVVAAVAGRTEVLVDGGIRDGIDVLKALALGADGVLIGRPALWGLASAGAAGVVDVLRTLCSELEEAMVLSGRPKLADIDGSLVQGKSRGEARDECTRLR
jgi:4-hydroxymandelate oxidase